MRANDKTAEFLDTITNLKDYVDRFAGEKVYELMKAIDDDFNKYAEIQDSEYFQGYVFNWWDAYDLVDYLHERFGVESWEEVTIYLCAGPDYTRIVVPRHLEE